MTRLAAAASGAPAEIWLHYTSVIVISDPQIARCTVYNNNKYRRYGQVY